jgi:hypothetical protein
MSTSTSTDEIKEPLPTKEDFESIEPETLAEVTTATPESTSSKPAQ